MSVNDHMTSIISVFSSFYFDRKMNSNLFLLELNILF